MTLVSQKVKDYMAGNLVTFTPDMEMSQAIGILVKQRISGAPVVDGHGNVVGLLSEKDCMKVALSSRYHEDPQRGIVSEYMTTEVVTIEADLGIVDVARMFSNSSFRRYPVVEENRLIGQISRRDVLRALMEWN